MKDDGSHSAELYSDMNAKKQKEELQRWLEIDIARKQKPLKELQVIEITYENVLHNFGT